MADFEEKIEERKRYEDELLSDSFQSISKAVAKHKIGSGFFGEGRDVQDAITQLLRYLGVKEKKTPDKLKTLEDKLDYLLASTGIFYRSVRLEGKWYQDAMGIMMGTMKADGAAVTILPGDAGGFVYIDPHTGRRKKIDRKEAEKLNEEAYSFYRSFPMRALKPTDIWRYMQNCLSVWDILTFVAAALMVTFIGLLIPKLNKILTGTVVSYGSQQLLASVMIFLLCVTIGHLVFATVKQLLQSRIGIKMSSSITAATMMRVLSLPTDFFQNYSTGELNQYLSYITSMCDAIVEAIFSAGLTGLFSLVYLIQVFSFARVLVLPSLIVTVLTIVVSLMTTSAKIFINKEQMKLEAEELGLVYSTIDGIQKIRLSGAENRAFARWADCFARGAELTYNPPAQVKFSQVITMAISMVGTIFIYYLAVKNNVSVSDYYAFNTSYGYITTALTSLTSVGLTAAKIKPGLELIRPLLEAEPENSEGLETVTELSGEIEISNVSFRYQKEGPMVLRDISLHVPKGQYVAVVGKTGCGKSTLLRLLLGFEKPTMGNIYYDKKDIAGLDMHSVRKQIGTVMQDGKLFQGSIYDNIVIAAPEASLEDAWEAAEIAGIADDIRQMPMGMHTMISGMAGGVSGGQKQRLMIARAVAPRPKLLFLDEATSALDNLTQKHVSESLDALKCTRLVIAHRLSTIRHCDRILVIDEGKIVEDGTYDELIEKKGYFAELVERQRI